MIKRKTEKVAYYIRNIFLDIVPSSIFRRQLATIMSRTAGCDPEFLRNRINYYNKLDSYIDFSNSAPDIQNISLKQSFYYYDLKEPARYFPRNFRLDYAFGDVTFVPEFASFVKSRPIRGRNANSLIMKLNKFRHFYIPKDTIPFEAKKPLAVWRGGEHNSKRVELMRGYRGHPLCDIGYTNVNSADVRYSPFLKPIEQMAFKYVISIEGNDVATNLKWILASNSLCMMPEPNYETWFMEGRLKAGEHYVQLGPGFDDLEEKIIYYERHPDEAREIVRNANSFVGQFLDEPREQVISLLVMYKYFVATRQLEPDESIAGLIWP